MELFPSMTYKDVMEMPFKEFKALHNIRMKRKIEENQKNEKERLEAERKHKQQLRRTK